LLFHGGSFSLFLTFGRSIFGPNLSLPFIPDGGLSFAGLFSLVFSAAVMAVLRVFLLFYSRSDFSPDALPRVVSLCFSVSLLAVLRRF